MNLISIYKRALAELTGTFGLVISSYSGTVIMTDISDTGLSLFAGSIAFGLMLASISYAIGRRLGCHLNPAVSIILAVNRRLSFCDLPLYIIAQMVGILIAMLFIVLLRSYLFGYF